jgi:hypothetical protein
MSMIGTLCCHSHRCKINSAKLPIKLNGVVGFEEQTEELTGEEQSFFCCF